MTCLRLIHRFNSFQIVFFALLVTVLQACGGSGGGNGSQNVAPVFTSNNISISVAENTAAIGYTAVATDSDGDTLTYHITGGDDQSVFSIESNSGVLIFETVPDFELPTDSDGKNTYVVEITASDGTDSVVQSVIITVTDVIEPITFTSRKIISVSGGVAITGYTAAVTGADANAVVFSLTGGPDQLIFAIDSNSGVLSFQSAPNFEVPADSDLNNIYIVDVSATDGTDTVVQTVMITVTTTNEFSPVFSSTTAVNVNENTTVTGYTAVATDGDGDTVSFSLRPTAGTDYAVFRINSDNGVLNFLVAPDFESPVDNDENNIYQIDIAATGGETPVVQRVTITVLKLAGNMPIFTSGTAISVVEGVRVTGYVAVATDADGDEVTYSITDGPDRTAFSVDSINGALSFRIVPDFEVPADSGGINQYVVEISATDGTYSVAQSITVTVTNRNDNMPVFTSGTAISVVEGSTTVTGYIAVATDVDGDEVTYSITDGPDRTAFSVDSINGALSFRIVPDFEVPADSGGINQYVVEISATDGTYSVAQSITVTVTNRNDNMPVFTSGTAISVVEGGTVTGYIAVATDVDGDEVTYSITDGPDRTAFSVDSINGALSFRIVPDFEVPADSGGINRYTVEISAGDGTHSVAQSITVTVTNRNDNMPVFTSGTAISVVEGSTVTGYIAVATDVDGDEITYSITDGPDRAAFSVDSINGALSFRIVPDFEVPADSGGINRYTVEISADDGTHSVARSVTVTVIDIDDSPLFSISGVVSGLSGSGLVLQNNGGDDLAVPGTGTIDFTFLGSLKTGDSYNVTIATQPADPGEKCTIAGGSGIIGSTDISNILVQCPFDISWSNPRPQGKFLNKIRWINDRYMSVGFDGTIMSGSDGINWSIRSLGNVRLYDITWTGNQYVVVGDAGSIFTSMDGNLWVSRTSGTSNNLRGVTWTGSHIVAVGETGTVLVSTDGQVWVQRTSVTSSDLFGIAWNGNVLVIAGYSVFVRSDAAASDQAIIVTEGNFTINDIVWVGSKFVAVGVKGSVLIWPYSGISFASPDGSTWSEQPVFPASGFNSVTSTGSQLIAVGPNNSIVTSPVDNISWTARTSPDSDANLAGVAWKGNQAVAVSWGGTTRTSADGTTWTVRGSSMTRFPVLGLGAKGDQIVAVGGGTILRPGEILTASVLQTSTDEGDWVAFDRGASEAALTDAVWTGSLWVVVGDDGIILTSVNGLDWTEQASGTTNDLYKVYQDGSQVIVIGRSSTFLTSPGGVSWTLKASSRTLGDIAWSDSLLVGIGFRDIVISEDGGDTWSKQTRPETLSSIVWTGKLFVIGGKNNQSGRVLTSPDGTTWTVQDFGLDNIIDLDWNGKIITMLTDSGQLYTSIDGLAWTSQFIGIFADIAWDGQRHVMSGGRTKSAVVYYE